METLSFTKTFQFHFGNVFIFHLDAVASPGSKASKSDLSSGLPIELVTFLIAKWTSSVELNSCLVKATFSLPNRSKSEGQVQGVRRVIDWKDSESLQTFNRLLGSVGGGIVHKKHQACGVTMPDQMELCRRSCQITSPQKAMNLALDGNAPIIGNPHGEDRKSVV
jgi:hypothetical protein